LVAVTHVDPESHATVGVDVMVVEVVDNRIGVPPPVENVVDVAVMSQPAPEPVASLTSSAWLAVTVWLSPLSVALNVTLGGALTNASEPPVIVAVAVVAPAGAAGTNHDSASAAAAPTVIAFRSERTTQPSNPPGNGGQVGGKGRNLRNVQTLPMASGGLGDAEGRRGPISRRQGGPPGRRQYPWRNGRKATDQMDTAIDGERLVEAANRLQGLPASLTQLASIVASDDFSLRDVVEVISYDPALTARLLRAANSAVSAASSPVGTVHDAVVRLGAGPVLTIATGDAVGSRMRRNGAAGDTALWAHSIRTAAASEAVKRTAACDVPAVAMTGALLHDVGKLVLAEALSPHVLRLLEEVAENEDLTSEQAETAVLMVHHGELGAIAARAWMLPDDITEAILHHHDAGQLAGTLGSAVALADRVAYDGERGVEAASPTTLELLDHLGIAADAYPSLLATAAERYEMLAERLA